MFCCTSVWLGTSICRASWVGQHAVMVSWRQIRRRFYESFEFKMPFDIDEFNQIKPYILCLLHTNLALVGKQFDDLNLVLSLLKWDFHIICISDKIGNSVTTVDLDGYHLFILPHWNFKWFKNLRFTLKGAILKFNFADNYNNNNNYNDLFPSKIGLACWWGLKYSLSIPRWCSGCLASVRIIYF